jgi:hypothetical protein
MAPAAFARHAGVDGSTTKRAANTSRGAWIRAATTSARDQPGRRVSALGSRVSGLTAQRLHCKVTERGYAGGYSMVGTRSARCVRLVAAQARRRCRHRRTHDVRNLFDVTGRKQADEGHELRAGEMSHRVKNLLAIASGLTAITLRSATDIEDMAHHLTARLMVLGVPTISFAGCQMAKGVPHPLAIGSPFCWHPMMTLELSADAYVSRSSEWGWASLPPQPSHSSSMSSRPTL